MKVKPLYSVDKHVTMAMYFDKGHALRRAQMYDLWVSWKRIPNGRAAASFCGTETALKKPAMTDLGDTTLLDAVPVDDTAIVEGGGTYTRQKVLRNSMIDCDFYSAHESGSRDYGLEMPRTYFWTLSKQWMNKLAKNDFLAILKEQLATLDASKPFCGLVDYSFSQDTYAGFLHGSPFCFSTPLTQCIQRFRWLDLWNNGIKKLRGLYWGNYLSNQVMSQMGGRDDFLQRYHGHLQFISRKIPSHIWEYPNGIFIRLTPNIANVEPGKRIDGVSSQNFQWLARELDRYELLL